MKKVIRLSESDLMRIVKRIINETDKEKVIRGILQGRQPKPQYIEYDGEKQPSPFDSDENISYDIKSVECDGSEYKDGHVDIDEDDTIVIRYCKGDTDSLEYLKSKGKKLLRSNLGF
jgi:hypothetical protein